MKFTVTCVSYVSLSSSLYLEAPGCRLRLSVDMLPCCSLAGERKKVLKKHVLQYIIFFFTHNDAGKLTKLTPRQGDHFFICFFTYYFC